MLHVNGVNSVSLQPLFVLTHEFMQVRQLARLTYLVVLVFWNPLGFRQFMS